VAESTDEVCGAARAPAVDVVLLHATGGVAEGAETIWDLRGRLPKARVIVLAPSAGEAEILRCIEAGAVACLGEDTSCEGLCRAIRGAVDGEAACPATLLGAVARRIRQLDAALDEPAPPGWDRLSARQSQVAALAAAGLANKQIARRLRIRPATVKKHVHHVMDKLSVRRRREFARRAWPRQTDGEPEWYRITGGTSESGRMLS